ncbi:hypothetical protein BX616_010021 [Lobosporangium transversale]|nr:hypothetical protein BX616_010021 [Lobosporangium transversale]
MCPNVPSALDFHSQHHLSSPPVLAGCRSRPILPIYSQVGDQYANSIRWGHQGGYMEMISSLYNSLYIVPSRTKCIMVITILASLVAGLLDKGVARFISPAERLIKGDSILEITPQIITIGPEITFSGWSKSIRYGENVTEAMGLLINSTKNITTAEASSRRLYILRQTDYDIVCAQSNVQFTVKQMATPPLGSEKCSETSVYLQTDLEAPSYNITNVVQGSSNQWSVVITGGKELGGTAVGIEFRNQGVSCGLGGLNMPFLSYLQSKMNTLPSTVIKKCVHENGDVLVMAATAVKFLGFNGSIPSDSIEEVFQGADEIFQAMNALIIRTVTSRDKYPTLLAEVRIRGPMIDIVLCTFVIFFRSPLPICLYSVINLLVVRPKEQIVHNVKARSNWRPLPDRYGGNDMVIEHFPPIIHGERALASIPQLQDDTVAVSQYMASLGHNFYMDFDGRKAYVLYDVFTPEKGLEIPMWLLVFIIVAMVACFYVWVLTELLLDGKYTSSLYKTISIQLTPHNPVSALWIMRADIHPMAFESIRVVPKQEEMEMNTGSTKSLLTNSP